MYFINHSVISVIPRFGSRLFNSYNRSTSVQVIQDLGVKYFLFVLTTEINPVLVYCEFASGGGGVAVDYSSSLDSKSVRGQIQQETSRIIVNKLAKMGGSLQNGTMKLS